MTGRLRSKLSKTGVDLDRNAANFVPLTPISFLEYASSRYANRVAVVYGEMRRSWAEVHDRARRLASALRSAGVGRGDTVAILGANTPEVFEAHFGVPMAGAVLNMINLRLDPSSVASILEQENAKLLITDREFSRLAGPALRSLGRAVKVIDIDDKSAEGGELLGGTDYEAFVAGGDPDFVRDSPVDEWETIAVSFTSGTTGAAKGVAYSHRGAYLSAVSNSQCCELSQGTVYLWTLPMFHCNGWSFAWSLAMVGGTSVCLRQVRVEAMVDTIRREGVSHLCGAPLVLNMLTDAPTALKRHLPPGVTFVVGGAAPSARLLEAAEEIGFKVIHGYGLTETYGAAAICAWRDEWRPRSPEECARLKSRQGMRVLATEDLMVADPDTLLPVPRDGLTLGEVVMRGNNVMKGYVNDPLATAECFRGGWFHTGDLAVWHADGYIEIKDRSKDMINSGGEKISSMEVEAVLLRHHAVAEVAVVAKADPEWGEAACAFINLKSGATVDEREIISFCRRHLAHYKVPRVIVFGPLPKTASGKIKKAELREQTSQLSLLI